MSNDRPFSADSLEASLTLAMRIKRAGGALESEPADTPWGARVFRLRDPDGFRLTISSHAAT